jgi:uracil-DNA glycosylase
VVPVLDLPLWSVEMARSTRLSPEETAARFVPPNPTLEALHAAAQSCTACPLYENATQAVLGGGNPQAAILLIGEQPGHEEDLAGLPFVGPAGRLLDKALAEAGLEPTDVFKTNAVKHFKHQVRGKRRIHDSPNRYEVEVCKPWLRSEIWLVQPRCLVPLGATAAVSVLGKSTAISRARGALLDSEWGVPVVVTYHPSAALRARDSEERRRLFDMLVEDLRLARKTLD